MEVVDKNKLYDCSPYVQATNFTQLMLCVLNNDVKNAANYIGDINTKSSYDSTALHIACKNSKRFSFEEMVEFLLRNGADPNAKDNDDWTPLHHAVYDPNNTGSLEIVDLLLRNGADPNIKNDSGRTPLHFTSSLKIVELLLQSGADLNIKDIYGWTPLVYASNYFTNFGTSSLKIVETLLRNGATPINTKTQILKLEIDIESLVEENKRLQQRILVLENEED